MPRPQPDTKPAHAVDEDLLNVLVKSVRPKGKCTFAAYVERDRPDLMPTFEAAIDRGVLANVIATTCRDLGIEVPATSTISRHVRRECSCQKASS